ncbi:hypothetical protein CgunFtcFv8_006311 [Champsocephalus gunnari]|uniref:Uncharacterized protein n=1 Tax=Champsocephalus gunnari TaxID=52237 RepID=A0AAN8GZ66_CHAGU|nr:hypothetical protein CgunFtcFv8_006311 [Champsocephalus gunnari]
MTLPTTLITATLTLAALEGVGGAPVCHRLPSLPRPPDPASSRLPLQPQAMHVFLQVGEEEEEGGGGGGGGGGMGMPPSQLLSPPPTSSSIPQDGEQHPSTLAPLRRRSPQQRASCYLGEGVDLHMRRESGLGPECDILGAYGSKTSLNQRRYSLELQQLVRRRLGEERLLSAPPAVPCLHGLWFGSQRRPGRTGLPLRARETQTPLSPGGSVLQTPEHGQRTVGEPEACVPL